MKCARVDERRGHRDALGRQFGDVVRDDPAFGLVERGGAGEERSGVPVFAHAEKEQVEVRRPPPDSGDTDRARCSISAS